MNGKLKGGECETWFPIQNTQLADPFRTTTMSDRYDYQLLFLFHLSEIKTPDFFSGGNHFFYFC